MARGMIISTLRFVPLPKRHSEALEILRFVVGPAESQPGCLSCHIYEEDGANHATIFCSHWETEAALRAHIQSELYLRVLAACELSSRPPEFCFHQVSETRGMELIHQLRECSGEQSLGA